MKENFKQVNKWFLVGCGIVILAVIAMVIMVLINGGNKNKELVCKSAFSSITIYYNKNTIDGYTTNGYTYNLLSEQSKAEQMGVDKYIEEYASTFNRDTMGTCTIQK